MGTLNNETTKTQISEILDYLKTGRGVSQSEAYKLFGTQRLASRIWDLKRRGFEIYAEPCYGQNRHERRVNYNRYWLIGFQPSNAVPVEAKTSKAQKRFDAALYFIDSCWLNNNVREALKIAAGLKI